MKENMPESNNEKFGMARLLLFNELINLRPQERELREKVQSAKNEKQKSMFQKALENIQRWIRELAEAYELLNNEQKDKVIATQQAMPQGEEAGIKKDPSKPAAQPAITEQQDSEAQCYIATIANQDKEIEALKEGLRNSENRKEAFESLVLDCAKEAWNLASIKHRCHPNSKHSFADDRDYMIEYIRKQFAAQPTQPLPAQGE